ncbi:MAG: ABC transporter permease [Saprospiraceae bacterium]|nr:ABC transporter permease [Saprospiraceae bacterium]MCB0622511.1 ABC transporter permease [Saprospiraceae bacterium]MCB0675319.1 ABC transporter permease [Saprospiraceae bacterium]MCB0681526.1 ABC transporter permease [Saprospiraceae bacterium]
MHLSIRIARRYLFARKSTNAINIITAISVLGITIGTAALILVLSVFNGFEDLITGLFSNFNPDVKVTVAKGKTFVPDTIQLGQLRQLEGVAAVSETLEEVAFFQYKNSEDFGILKGVDEYFSEVTKIDSTVREGIYRFDDQGRALAVLGVGMRNKLTVNVEDYLSTISVYMPKRGRVGPLEKPFREKFIYPAGTFVIQQDFDNQYVLCSIGFAREVLDAGGEVSALEIKLRPGSDQQATIASIRDLLGEEFVVKDRYQQDEAFLKLMNIEKWMSYAILSLTLLLVAFNMIGSLWMIVLEKKNDIAILKSMGATNVTIRDIFLYEGLLLCLFGMLIGFTVAILLYLVHTNIDGGIISIPQGFLVTAYPISMRLPDFFVIALTVVVIGLIASLPPALRAKRVPPLILEE